MAIPYGSVSKLTPGETLQLANWNFLDSYSSYRIELVDLAKDTYLVTCRVLNAPPSQDQFYQSYWRSLRWTDLYLKAIFAGKLLQPSIYDYYAGLLAKYVIEQDWGAISSASCP